MRETKDMIARLLGVLHKVLLTFFISSLGHHIEKAEEIQTINRLHEEGLNDSRILEKNEAADRSHDPHSLQATLVLKNKVIATFDRVRSRGARARTRGPAGLGESYVIRECDLHECFEELGGRLLQWGRFRL